MTTGQSMYGMSIPGSVVRVGHLIPIIACSFLGRLHVTTDEYQHNQTAAEEDGNSGNKKSFPSYTEVTVVDPTWANSLIHVSLLYRYMYRHIFRVRTLYT